MAKETWTCYPSSVPSGPSPALESRQARSPALAMDPIRTPVPLRHAYLLMRDHFGHQHWWPGDSPFEVCVGAILTQNTAWNNVERAIARLKAAKVLAPVPLWALPETDLAQLIQPAGCFRVKARRIRAFLSVLMTSLVGRLDRLLGGPAAEARRRLLDIPGIGPETADCMLLYAGGQASFVIDAYTRRVFLRHGWAGKDFSYDQLQALAAQATDPPPSMTLVDYWQDAHAQLVAVGKSYCRAREARCAACPLKPLLP